MTLQDMESFCLSILQQSSPQPNFGNAPAWGGVTNPIFPQATIDFFLNEGYRQFLADTEEIELALVTYTFSSTALAQQYAFPPAGYAECSKIARVYYMPNNQLYSLEFEPGVTFTSWDEFQQITGFGYLRPYAFGTQPTLCAIDPQRANIVFYPGTANAGDTITIQYIPLPTAGATGCPTLVNPTDAPITKSDTHIAIVYRALAELWIKAREAGMAQTYMQKYEAMVADTVRKYQLLSHGDNKRIRPFGQPRDLHIGTGM